MRGDGERVVGLGVNLRLAAFVKPLLRGMAEIRSLATIASFESGTWASDCVSTVDFVRS